jgi:hypothetical protein
VVSDPERDMSEESAIRMQADHACELCFPDSGVLSTWPVSVAGQFTLPERQGGCSLRVAGDTSDKIERVAPHQFPTLGPLALRPVNISASFFALHFSTRANRRTSYSNLRTGRPLVVLAFPEA